MTSFHQCALLLLLWCLLGCCVHIAIAGTEPGKGKHLLVGVDANYSLELEKNGTVWKEQNGKACDLFTLLHRAGVNSFRVRVWANDDGLSGRDYALDIARRAQRVGMQPLPVLFLSDNWADYVKQPAPARWQKLAFAEKLKSVTEYSRATALAFKHAGIKTDLYEIGNEIDFGICGEFAENWGDRFNLLFMRAHIWPNAAQVIAAAEAGIRTVNPKAHFVLHLAQWWNPSYCKAFIAFMQQHHVAIDYFGLSFYPSSGLAEKNTFADLTDNVNDINKNTGLPILLLECGYPSLPTFGGQFSTWNKAVPGYELSEQGQAQWVAALLAVSKATPAIRGFYYWSPELYTQELWSAFSLFHADGIAKQGLWALSGK